MTDRSLIHDALAAGDGVLRLEPTWVPRSFMIPGRRLRLHPDDLYAFGGHRGGINERWLTEWWLHIPQARLAAGTAW